MNIRRFLRRLGDTQLPIGSPWYRCYWYFGLWVVTLPINWQGWLVWAGFLVWMLGSVTLFIVLQWEVSVTLALFWGLPTLVAFLLVTGIKTDVRRD
jgi:hypothetical protein